MNTLTALSRYVSISLCLWLVNISYAAVPAQEVSRTPPGSQVRRLWAPVADEVYLQEVGEKVVTDKPAAAVALRGEAAYVVVGGALKILRGGVLVDAEGAPGGVKRRGALGRGGAGDVSLRRERLGTGG